MESLERKNLLAGDGFHNYLTPGDVNNDSPVSALDALTVINHLNRSAASGEELQARLTGPSGERAKVELEDEHGLLKLEVKIQNALPGESYDVAIGGSVVATLVTDSRSRASLETSGLSTTIVATAAGDTVSINGIGTATFVGEGSDHDHDSDEGNHDDFGDGLDSNDDSSSNDSDDLQGNDSIDDRSNHDGIDSDHDDGNVSDNDNDHSPLTPIVGGSQYAQWQARLTGVGSGKAEFEIERGEMEFEVEVRGLTANTSYPVSIAGVVVGQLRTNSRGKGELEYEVGDDDHRPFPTGFPAIAAGTSVSVGDQMRGVFAVKLNDHDDSHHDDDDDCDDHDRDDDRDDD